MRNEPQPRLQTHTVSIHHSGGSINPLPFFHFHNDMEVNFLSRGERVYNCGGRAMPLPLRKLTVFWGGVSHRVEVWKPGCEIWVVSVPLGLFLSWGLPHAFAHRLLQGVFVNASDSTAAKTDEEAMRRWNADLNEAPGNSPHR
ncbi:MAG: hypothetical protein FWF96_04185, partial [Kiritimatiellaeota bacterium]|nr:hypothetical protein [Kiritimatiellota bacterium]